MSNIYYGPEAFGLSIVMDLQMYEEDYSYDRLVVWKDLDAEIYFWAEDSGCSCPSPFEWAFGREHLQTIDRATLGFLIRHVNQRLDQRSYYGGRPMWRELRNEAARGLWILKGIMS